MKRKAQSILEYTILLLVVASAIGGMRMYLIRSVKGQFKNLQDQVSGTAYSTDKITAPEVKAHI